MMILRCFRDDFRTILGYCHDFRMILRWLFDDFRINANYSIYYLNYSISKDAYDYYNGLLLLVGSGSPAEAIPDNPISNIDGGGLGFFNTCQIDSVFTIINE